MSDESDEEWLPAPSESDEGEDDERSSGVDGDVSADVQCTSPELRDTVVRLIREDTCKKCIAGKATELENLLCSTSRMTPAEKKTSILTSLSILAVVDTAQRRRGKGERLRYTYILPLVGEVCRDVFCAAFGVSTASVNRYRRQVESGAISPADHGRRMNTNAAAVDVDWLVDWFRTFARAVGDLVPLRVRKRIKENGRTVFRRVQEDYILIPPTFTWSRLHQEMTANVRDSLIRRYEPAESTFRQILTDRCSDVKIRSPKDNVCDFCVMYRNKMKRNDDDVETAESLGEHTHQAQAMMSVALLIN